MRYVIDDRALAAFLMELRPDYIEVRAVSEAQQFLAAKGKALRMTDILEPAERPAMDQQMAQEAMRQEACRHIWDEPVGHRNPVCRMCGAVDTGPLL